MRASRFAVVSHVVPPSTSGQSALIYRLLEDLDPRRYCLISQGLEDADIGSKTLPTLPGRYRSLPAAGSSRLGRSKILRALRLLALIMSRARRIARIAREERCGAIVVFTGDLLNLPASALASIAVRVPFFVYVCDYYSQQWVNPLLGLLARRIEPHVVRRSSGIIVPNEFMRDELRRRFGVESKVIYHSCDLALYQSWSRHPLTGRPSIRVVYTGAVSPAQIDALQNLIDALDGTSQIELHIYSGQSRGLLDELGLQGHFVHHGHERLSAMPRVQSEADILFLPLAFDSPYPKLVKTAAPFKMGEYLAARRPILVHAPPDSFLSWYFRRYECGVVVDRPDPALLAEAIVRLASDEPLQKRLASRAWERARLDFDSERARRSFLNVLSTG